jgi:hypothetical protein
MIGRLLNEDNLAEAEKLASELNHTSEDLVIVRAMLSLVQNSAQPSQLPLQVHEIIRRRIGAVHLATAQPMDALDVLSRCSVFAKPTCERITVYYKVWPGSSSCRCFLLPNTSKFALIAFFCFKMAVCCLVSCRWGVCLA